MSIKTDFSKTAMFAAAIAVAGSLIFSESSFAVCPQDKDQSSRREAGAIKKIESAGGRVHQISAQDESLEISFSLSSKPIDDEQLKDIDSIGNVIWLNLAGTKVTNEGLKHLAGLPLKKLHLERTEIGDAGLEHLESLKELEYLNLYQTKVSDAGIERLAKIKSLKKLYVWKSAITEEGIEKLSKLLPDAQVVGALKLEPVKVEPKPEPEKEMKKDEPQKTEVKKAEQKKKAGSK